MHYFADQFIKNKKSINQNSTLNKNGFNYKSEDSNIDLSPIKMNNSSIISLPICSSNKNIIYQISMKVLYLKWKTLNNLYYQV